MIPHINGKDDCFMADLLATAGHIPIPYVMGLIETFADYAREN
jgi:hypothetical protein